MSSEFVGSTRLLDDSCSEAKRIFGDYGMLVFMGWRNNCGVPVKLVLLWAQDLLKL